MLMDHGVTPQMPKATAGAAADGSVDRARFARRLEPWLGSAGLDMLTARIPWLGWTPSYAWKYSAGRPALLRYLTNLCRVYKDNGWQSKAYAYPLDEPISASTERKAEALARTLHKASARSGFRCSFLLTDDPRPTTLHAMLPANKYLWDDVDIWCLRYYYFFGRVPILRQVKAKGAQVWWYPYCNSAVAKLPNFVIDKSLADSRVWGWLMEQWNVDGMLYWGTSRWGTARTNQPGRDPYKNPLSFISADGRYCNGEAMLIYPGYYPRYGLNDRNAPPVSSLRLEALRDGFEDLEYMKLAEKTAGIDWVRSVIKRVTTYPYAIRYGHIFTFPKYVTAASTYLAARAQLAQRIEADATTP